MLLVFVYVYVFCFVFLSAYMSVHQGRALCSRRLEGFIRFPETGVGVKDSYQPLFECWRWDQGPLKEQPVLLATESSFQPVLN